MSFSSLSQAPINLTSKLEMDIKSETEELEGHTAIKRHTIDAILGLPRLAGFHQVMNRTSFSESEADLADKEKSGLDGEGELDNTPSTTAWLYIIDILTHVNAWKSN